jgi:hypothetical protein
MTTISMEMWKKKKMEKNKEKCRKYYEKKRQEGTNAKNGKYHCGYFCLLDSLQNLIFQEILLWENVYCLDKRP